MIVVAGSSFLEPLSPVLQHYQSGLARNDLVVNWNCSWCMAGGVRGGDEGDGVNLHFGELFVGGKG